MPGIREDLQITGAMRTVKRIGTHRMEGGLYQDEQGRYYCDCHNEPSEDGTIDIYILSPCNDQEGEPDHCVKAKLLNPPTERERREKAFQFEYMMLSRFQHYGVGKIEDYVEHWAKIPADLKPDWIPENVAKKFEQLINQSNQ